MPGFTRDALREYFRVFERSSLDELARVAGPDSTLKHALYGRNGAGRGKKPGEGCDSDAFETWHITGYGSLAAILDAALRHDHEDGLRWLARAGDFALEIIPWWIEHFGQPPGEDARFEPCEDREKMLAEGKKGDTDIDRHDEEYGLLLLLIEPKVRALGGWGSGDVKDFAVSLLRWIQDGAFGTIIDRRREYLRYGNRWSTLSGLCRVFRQLGEPELEAMAYQLLRQFIYWAYAPSNLTKKAVGTDGRVWPIYCYGEMALSERTGRMGPAFPYGYYPYGGQSWYLGHRCNGLVRAAEIASMREDKAFFSFLSEVFRIETRWIDPMEQRTAPIVRDAPYGEPVEDWLKNSMVQGGKRSISSLNSWVRDFDQTRGLMLSIQDYERLEGGESFTRHCFVDYHEGDDDPYWTTAYQDPLGVVHHRGHGSRDRGPSLPGLEVSNAYACVDALLFRGFALGRTDLVRWAEIMTGELLAFANTSDKEVDLRRAIDPENGLSAGMNRVGGFARDYHWAWQVGYYTRRILCGVVAEGGRTTRDGRTLDAGGSLEE